MKISLIISAYNEEKYIGSCLESIEKNGKDFFEVIVVNNASTDNTEEIVKQFKNVRILFEGRKGLPNTRQRGLSEASGDIVAFVDADTQMPVSWVEKIKKMFEKNPKLVCLSGPYIYYDTSIFRKILIWIYWILGMAVILFVRIYGSSRKFCRSKKFMEKIGGFNQDIHFYGDDTDIAKRLSKIGKVEFSLRFYMYTSARRLVGEGLLKTAYTYAINFLWVIFTGKAFTSSHKDIR